MPDQVEALGTSQNLVESGERAQQILLSTLQGGGRKGAEGNDRNRPPGLHFERAAKRRSDAIGEVIETPEMPKAEKPRDKRNGILVHDPGLIPDAAALLLLIRSHRTLDALASSQCRSCRTCPSMSSTSRRAPSGRSFEPCG